MFKKQVPAYSLFAVFIITALAAFFITSSIYKKNEKEEIATIISSQSVCNYDISRLTGYKYVEPLLFAERSCESSQLNPIKSDIEGLINNYKSQGVITDASVYLRVFHTNDWISINDEAKYNPGSLLKVPELITFYKMNELHPGFFDKKILIDRDLNSADYNKTPTFLSKTIEKGKTYTVRELLKYMIAYSDNRATIALNSLIDVSAFNKVFTDVGLAAPDAKASSYPLTAREYSLFMKELYNATYLTIEDSEECTELLGQCDFTQGICAGIPPSDKVVAHKFGEGGSPTNPELSESAIIYYNKTPYLLTIMTKGTDMKKLPAVLSTISKLVYQKMT